MFVRDTPYRFVTDENLKTYECDKLTFGICRL